MPFGKYAGNSVQSLSGLFDFAGSINAGYGLNKAARRALGKKRVTRGAIGGGAIVGLGALGRTSGANGLQSKSSAPPPQNPYGGY